MTLQFEIPGKPFGKQRPRMTRQGRAYTPAETVSFERTVGQYAMAAGAQPVTGPVRLSVIAVFEVPPSWSKAKQAAHLHRAHTSKPDLDNCVKAILDGLNRIAFADDGQVAEITCRKVYGLRANTIVTVEAM
jgi:Holliday junction resolvase RusA-like endonuclease